jgi:hypothetical protein
MPVMHGWPEVHAARPAMMAGDATAAAAAAVGRVCAGRQQVSESLLQTLTGESKRRSQPHWQTALTAAGQLRSYYVV